MNIYFAPLEGLTDSIYRRLHQKYFGGVEKYYTPFLSPTIHRALTAKEKREIPPAAEQSNVVPQILTKSPQDFLWLANVVADLGYKEINLNLGCPSGTVFSKGKGSGMLTSPDALCRFLDEVYSYCPIPLSIKTRLGVADREEFPRLLNIYNCYPVSELTLHPRVRAQFYKGSPDKEMFSYCLENSKAPVCYNGNLCTREDIADLGKAFPDCKAVMLGRGLIADPSLAQPQNTNAATLQAFYDELLEEYVREFQSARNAMFRLKENWHYLFAKFDGTEYLSKKLRKTTDLEEYRALTREIFETLPMRKSVVPHW